MDLVVAIVEVYSVHFDQADSVVTVVGTVIEVVGADFAMVQVLFLQLDEQSCQSH